MIEMSFNGKKIRPSQFGNELEKAMYNQLIDNIKTSLRFLRCKEHHKAPSINVKGQGLKDFSVEIVGCCQSLIDQAQQKLR